MSRSVLINERQRKNPIIDYINVPKEYSSTIKADYVTGAKSCVLFLSLEYSKLKPDYIYERMSGLGREFPLRVLLVQVDVDNYASSIKDLTKACIINDFALILCWSAREAGTYIEQLKKNEKTQGELVKGTKKTNYGEQLQDALTSMRGINKTDALTLSTEFGSFREILRNSKPEYLEKVRGLGPRKVKVLSSTFNDSLGESDLLVQSQSEKK